MAMACLRLVTFPPLPPFPERRVPFFSRRIALATLLPAALPYFLELLFTGIPILRWLEAGEQMWVGSRECFLRTMFL